MKFGRYDFQNRLLGDAVLPPYKGSTFRGAFGGALKSVVCAVRVKECSTCLLAKRCVYARVFEITEGECAGKQRIAAPPHPYVIEPPLNSATRFAAGDRFDFSLLLFGEANDLLPYFIYAFEVMGEGGIGKKTEGKRPGFRVEQVLDRGESIYDGEARTLKATAPAPELAMPVAEPSGEPGVLEVRIITPLRLKSGNSLTAGLPFHILVRAMLRRVSSLFAYYGGGEPDLDYRGMVAAAQDVETVDSSLGWHDWERWSGRQEQTMMMGGVIGSITYRGKLAPFLPILELSREFHLGKQTTFGLGKIEYEYRPLSGGAGQ